MQHSNTAGCILLKFYIKPQPLVMYSCHDTCCILSKFYIKPQRPRACVRPRFVVSYRNSTSNHNCTRYLRPVHTLYLIEILHQTTTSTPSPSHSRELYLIEILHQTTTKESGTIAFDSLYLIEILHQTTTYGRQRVPQKSLYLIEILHQTTTAWLTFSVSRCCILSKFYIKPQLFASSQNCGFSCILSKFYIKPQHYVIQNCFTRVVSYRNSTSNHNSKQAIVEGLMVVSYRNSTSNHNQSKLSTFSVVVVSYRNSTSNHN